MPIGAFMDQPAAGTVRQIRLLLVNHHAIYLDALALFLSDQPDLLVVGTCPDVRRALDWVQETQPHVVVIDPGREAATLAELIGEMRRQRLGLGVVVLQLSAGRISEDLAYAAGGDAFVAKQVATDDLLPAIRRLAPPPGGDP